MNRGKQIVLPDTANAKAWEGTSFPFLSINLLVTKVITSTKIYWKQLTMTNVILPGKQYIIWDKQSRGWMGGS